MNTLCTLLSMSAALGIAQAATSKPPAAPKTPGASAAKPLPQTTPMTRGVVDLNPVTRNDGPSKTSLVLAQKGVAAVPIVISPGASKATQAVAQDLAQILQKVTGATFAVQPGDGMAGIVLGTLKEFPTPGLEQALAVKHTFDGREAFAIRTQPGRLLLVGNTDLGASHAAYRFLDEIGCRWFSPDPAWEVLPSVANLSFGRDITDRPAILSRQIWFEAGSGSKELNDSYTLWKQRNLQAGSFVFNAGHNMDTVIKVNKAAFDAHPEYLADIRQPDGTLKRMGPQLELSNPDVRKMVDDYAVNYFVQHPDADMVSLEPADTKVHSESPESLAMGSVSDRVFGMINEAARAVEQAYPGQGKMVGTLSYNAHWDPPSFPLENNVHVQLSGLGQGKYTSAEREKIWPTLSKNLGFYDYYSVWLWSFDLMPGSWINDIHNLQKNIGAKVATNGTSISAESTSSWGVNGRGYYIANRLMWNPDADVDALANDFYTKAFGAGATAMKHYYERLDPANQPLMSGHLLGLSFRDVDEASKATMDRPDVQARLDQLKLYLRYEQIIWMRDKEPIPGNQRAAYTQEMMKNLYRTRNYALTSWEMIRENWGKNKYPNKPDSPDWMVDQPYTHEEIEADFQDGLSHFAPHIRALGPRVAFSTDLVAVNWPATNLATTIGGEQFLQGTCRYALYSVHGEPLKFTTWAGKEWGGINSFTITDAGGKQTFEGHPKTDVTENHSIAVPGPGLYYLDYTDHGSTWTFHADPTVPATIPLGQTQDYRTKVFPDMYFYVPKGTKTIEYFYSKVRFQQGGAHQVIDPDGNVQQDVSVDGDYVQVPVPAGMDGKLWRFHQPVLGFFQFSNVPNYFAASPQALLVPRELAQKDGLTPAR